MTIGLSEGSLLFLDACCLINLLATDSVDEILGSLPYRLAVSRYVAVEEVRGRPLPESVAVLDLEGEAEAAELVRFATLLDDGEASVCALAVVRGGGVATDDRKALAVLRRLAPHVPTVQTPELMHEWARRSDVPEERVRRTLRDIRERARFHPRHDAPHHAWWVRLCGD